eukprot:43497-Amphidinium_carterae.1
MPCGGAHICTEQHAGCVFGSIVRLICIEGMTKGMEGKDMAVRVDENEASHAAGVAAGASLECSSSCWE